MLLFPEQSRLIEKEQITNKTVTFNELADKLQLPVEVVKGMLGESFEDLADKLAAWQAAPSNS